jgi:hypothetical protein
MDKGQTKAWIIAKVMPDSLAWDEKMSQRDRRPFSPLVLADYLISLAEYADRGGLLSAAKCLIADQLLYSHQRTSISTALRA